MWDAFRDANLRVRHCHPGWWPSVRPWRISKPEPTLRAISDVQEVAVKLRDAWTQATGMAANATPSEQSANPQVNNLQVSMT